MYPVTPYFELLHDPGFISQPFLPATAHGRFINIGLGQPDEHMIMACLALHETPVELAEILVPKAFAEPFETLAAPRFDQGKDQEPVQETLIFAASLLLKFH